MSGAAAPPPEAARVDDPVGHSLGMAGMLAGAALGLLVGAALIAGEVLTGGLLTVAIAGAVAGGALAGGQLAHGLQTIMHLPNPTTGTLRNGSPNVRVNGRGAVRAGVDGVYACNGLYSLNHIPLPLVLVAEGSKTVRVNGKPFARVGSRLMCAATVGDGSATVRVGGPTEGVLPVVDVEQIATYTAMVVGGGALLAAGGFAVAAGAFGEFLLTAGAVYGGNELLGRLGDRLGPGWRDVLQGGTGLVLLGAGGVKARAVGAQRAEAAAAARAAEQAATRERVLGNIAESQRARAASGLGRESGTSGRAGLSEAQQARAARKLAVSRERAATRAAREQRDVVAFFGRDAVDKYYLKDKVSIGAPGRSFFVMPVEDAAAVRNVADAARYTGMAPSAQEAYLKGGDVYGMHFSVPESSMRVPTPADAGGWPHYLEGGHTAVRLPDPNGGFLVNPTREFVIPGGGAPGRGAVLFKLGPNGERIPIRVF